MHVRHRIIAIAVLGCVAASGLQGVAGAVTPKHSESSFNGKFFYRCPGPDAVERASVSFSTTRFRRHDGVTKTITHTRWRGVIQGSDGTRIRDEGSWTSTVYRRGSDFLRGTTSGVVWHLTIPGEGIIIHQSGRQVTVDGGETFASTFAGTAESRPLCRYV
jgi:hypothetical protein